MYNKESCCTPAIHTDHHKHHSVDTLWHESPVIEKSVTGCNTSVTTKIQNIKVVKQYVEGVASVHCGEVDHNICRTLDDVATDKSSCCTPKKSHRRHTAPKLKHYELVCKPKPVVCCPAIVMHYANSIRGTFSTYYTYGSIDVTIKEIPAADIYIVNHEFVDLLIDEILGCLPRQNLSVSTVEKVKEYIGYYYEYYNAIEDVGSLHLNTVIALDAELLMNPVEVGRIKAVLTALENRLKGDIHGSEQ